MHARRACIYSRASHAVQLNQDNQIPGAEVGTARGLITLRNVLRVRYTRARREIAISTVNDNDIWPGQGAHSRTPHKYRETRSAPRTHAPRPLRPIVLLKPRRSGKRLGNEVADAPTSSSRRNSSRVKADRRFSIANRHFFSSS